MHNHVRIPFDFRNLMYPPASGTQYMEKQPILQLCAQWTCLLGRSETRVDFVLIPTSVLFTFKGNKLV